MPKRKFNKKVARQCLGTWLETLEARYQLDKLNDLVSRQNQSPGSSIHLSNLNYLSTSDIIVISMIAYATKVKALRAEILASLPDRIGRSPELTMAEKGIQIRFLEDCVRQSKPFYKSWQEKYFFFCPLRKLLGLLTSKETAQSLDRKLKPRLIVPRKVQKGDRIRGYRDHGTCRPNHKWLPKDVVSPSEAWNQTLKKLFEERLLQKHYLENPWWCCGWIKEIFEEANQGRAYLAEQERERQRQLLEERK